MTALIMANGEYGDTDWYRLRLQNFDYIICADGGTNWANKFEITPNMIVGDMDSIKEEVHIKMENKKVKFNKFSSDKDFTDTYLAMDILYRKGFKDITIWGGTGSRIDHSLANILSAASFVNCGVNIQFESPMLTVYFVNYELIIHGNIGDTVSILALGEKACGVSLSGFKYQLEKATLDVYKPIGISNVISDTKSLIKVESGLLSVFYNHENY